MVIANPHRGFAVMELSEAALIDLARARLLIETTALRESIADGDLGWESTVIATQHCLRRTPVTGVDGHINQDWTQAHRDFHHALLSGGISHRLTAIATGLRDCSELYVHWSRELAHDESRDVDQEHQLIADTTLARDADAAVIALGDHIERTTEALLNYVRI
jgi:DNA-binding GntR family transcriptional regulator